MRAMEKWTKDGGASFSTYAVPWINNRIYRFMFAHQNAIRTPVNHGFSTFSFVDDIEKVDFLIGDSEDYQERIMQLQNLDILLDICEESLTDRDYL